MVRTGLGTTAGNDSVLLCGKLLDVAKSGVTGGLWASGSDRRLIMGCVDW